MEQEFIHGSDFRIVPDAEEMRLANLKLMSWLIVTAIIGIAGWTTVFILAVMK